jgi:hypothetical protein
VPWVTAAVVAAALGAAAVQGLGVDLEYSRHGPSGTGLWRLASSQLVHWSWRMAAVDLGVILLAGVLVERRSRGRALASIAAGFVLSAVAVGALEVGIDRYRGSSGIAAALVVTLAAGWIARGRHWGVRALGAAGLGLFAARVGWEWMTGTAPVLTTLPAAVAPAPFVHLLGGAGGLAVAAWPARRPAR